MQVYFTVNEGRKFRDSSWCPLNSGCLLRVHLIQVSLYLQNFYGNQQVQKSVDNQFKSAIEQYRDDPDLQNAIDAVQEGVSKGTIFNSVVSQKYVACTMNCGR